MTKVRCAIYTRKSSDEGLDQAFNSLDAQREACEAYIKAQKHEGWRALPDHYDDGGASGGTLERKALQRLLAEVDAGRVDMVVVYKIDRLTRSLSDFAKLVERLDEAGASFVSVTQQFNTSTSMGRLTLNVLLSFAQFEREVTAERIRDKIAASKKKGLWMGGLVPLGYDKTDAGLVINTSEAETVRAVFKGYLETGNVARVKEIADRNGFRTKTRTLTSGQVIEGKPLSRGRLYHLLSNPIYVGKIAHRDAVYDGLHEAIISKEVWAEVQAKRSANAVDRLSRTNSKNRSPLAGKVFDEAGRSLTPNHAVKGGRRYRYYICQDTKTRLPAKELEAVVLGALSQDRELALYLDRTGIDALAKPDLLKRVQRVVVGRSTLGIDVRLGDETPTRQITTDFTLRRRGVERRMVLTPGEQRVPDLVLIKRVLRAMDWVDQIKGGKSTADIARSENISPEYITHNMDLAHLSPRVLEAIAAGRQRSDLSAYQLSKISIPAIWPDQDAIFLQ
ncbi:MAG: recombinase family protein [Pseudomonadota bacterium]